MRRKKFGILIFTLFLIIPTVPFFNTALNNSSLNNEMSEDTSGQLKTAQENLIWSRFWGSPKWDGGSSVWGDGSYIYTCGSTLRSDSVYMDLLLIKWDSYGNKLWNRTWDGGYSDNGHGIWGDGTYIYTCGETFGAGGTNLLLVKWDVSGNEMWNRTWGGQYEDYSRAVWGDGTYIYTCGYTASFDIGSGDLLLIKWDSAGNMQWYKTWGGMGKEIGKGIWGDETAIYTCGMTESFGAGDYDFVLVKWNSAGFKGWNRTWGGPFSDIGNGIWGDGLYIYTCGFTVPGYNDFALVKWNTFGDTIWNRTWGGSFSDSGYGIWGDGTFIYTCGSVGTSVPSPTASDACLVKWDSAGNQVWNSTWGGPYSDSFSSIWGDGTYIYTCGSSMSDSSLASSDLILLKWESSERLTFYLLSPAEGLVYESGTQINIHLDKELVILESFKYHWDNDDDTDWNEPYTTNLPMGDGLHTLYVSATTTVPYISDSKSFTFIADDNAPIVNIDSPTTNAIFSKAPAFDLDINEPHLAQRWYTLNDGPNYYFYSNAGTIDDSAWKALPDGDVKIEFCVTDTLGHLTEKSLVVRKDTKLEQRELMTVIRNAIITACITGIVGIAFFLIKRKIGKRKDKAVANSGS